MLGSGFIGRFFYYVNFVGSVIFPGHIHALVASSLHKRRSTGSMVASRRWKELPWWELHVCVALADTMRKGPIMDHDA